MEPNRLTERMGTSRTHMSLIAYPERVRTCGPIGNGFTLWQAGPMIVPTRQSPILLSTSSGLTQETNKHQGLIRKTTRTDFRLRRDLGRITPQRLQKRTLLFRSSPTQIAAAVSSSGTHPNPTPHPPLAKLAREAADASARKRKAADGGEATAAAPVPGEEVAMGDAPQTGGDGAADPNPIASLGADAGGGCSDPVSVELSMGGDYYHACCGDANLDIPEGPKVPFVGDKEPLSALAAEFQSGSPILQEKIQLLGEQYVALRRTRGDGNCFYRCFMFSYLEHILETQDKAEVDRIMKKIEQCKKTLQSLGYIEFTFEDFFSIFIELLENVLQGHETSIGPEELLERTRDDNVSDYAVMFFRFVTSGEIQRRAEFFEPFISGLTNSTVAQFCKISVEPMGEESDHVHIIALSDALGVPIRVMYLDRSSCDSGNLSVNHHDFIPASNSSESDAATSSATAAEKPYITLLYRPGHYDILYPK